MKPRATRATTPPRSSGLRLWAKGKDFKSKFGNLSAMFNGSSNIFPTNPKSNKSIKFFFHMHANYQSHTHIYIYNHNLLILFFFVSMSSSNEAKNNRKRVSWNDTMFHLYFNIYDIKLSMFPTKKNKTYVFYYTDGVLVP